MDWHVDVVVQRSEAGDKLFIKRSPCDKALLKRDEIGKKQLAEFVPADLLDIVRLPSSLRQCNKLLGSLEEARVKAVICDEIGCADVQRIVRRLLHYCRRVGID